VPTEVSEELTTVELSVVPVRVPAAAVTVMAADPSKFTPLMARAVASVVAVEALPVSAPTKVVEVTEVKPAIVVVVLPRLISVLPRVNEPAPVLRVEKVEPSRLTLSTLLAESKKMRPLAAAGADARF